MSPQSKQLSSSSTDASASIRVSARTDRGPNLEARRARRPSVRMEPKRRERYPAGSDAVDELLGRKSDTANERSGHADGVTRELSSRETLSR